ncbi:MAG TPA: T9SS type B sorting domain-containing protein, partial [Flavobacterium sp.]|nr:T9SS type B sorting domain-containing protein [Flavobacterium sp.]
FCNLTSVTIADIIAAGTDLIWYNSLSGIIALPDSTPLVSGVTYYATQTINGCESLDRLPVLVTIASTLSTTDYFLELCDNLNDGTEFVVLTNYSSDLVSSTAGISFSYYSTYENAEEGNTINQISPNYSVVTGTNIIFARLDFANGCHQVVTLEFVLHTNPQINIDNTVFICPGVSYSINTGNGFDNYLWSTNETTPQITISQPGSYSVTATNNYGSLSCSSIKTFTAVQVDPPTILSIETQDFGDNNSITIIVSGNRNDYEYSIDEFNFQANNTFSNLSSGAYTVSVRNKLGCNVITEQVYLLNYPHFFTPNNDGYNDFWKVKFSQYEPNLITKIFDRFGKLITILSGNSVGWNGKLNNHQLPADDYWFVIIRENGKEYKGHFALKR